jgi:hypothetical protein
VSLSPYARLFSAVLAVTISAAVALLLFGCARADALPPPTAACVVIGWDSRTREILYIAAFPFSSIFTCRAGRDAITPQSDNKVEFASLCVAAAGGET